jgi:hypothetical protein
MVHPKKPCYERLVKPVGVTDVEPEKVEGSSDYLEFADFRTKSTGSPKMINIWSFLSLEWNPLFLSEHWL